jgi:O-antigen ligase
MSLRVMGLYLAVTFLLAYVWKDWFKSLCGLILLMAVIEYEDMPKSLFGIQGLNAWNVLFLSILVAWAVSRRREELTWDMPRHVRVLLLIYLAIILVGVFRSRLDPGYMTWYPLRKLISEQCINTIKWVLPGLLLFDSCRTRGRAVMALICILALYFMISVLVIRRLPIEAAFKSSLSIDLARKKLPRSIGYNTGQISSMLSGAFWGLLATLPLMRKKRYWIVILTAAGVILFGQALSGGRGGYLAWGVTGLAMCLLKWRKSLILVPIVIVLIPIIFPGVIDRMLVGLGGTDVAGQSTIDSYALTSGRSVVWPYVIHKISEAPLFGYGQLAMQRTGLAYNLIVQNGEYVTHPHSMYLEILLDNGILGSLPIFFFFGLVVVYSARLFRSENRLCSAIGGLSLATTLAQLVAGLTSEHFYPRESTFGMWAAIFLMFRAYVEEKQVKTNVIEYPHLLENAAGSSRIMGVAVN